MNRIDRRLGHDGFVGGRGVKMGAASISEELEDEPRNRLGRSHRMY